MNVYRKYLKMKLMSQMQYRASFFLAALGQFLTAFTSFFGIKFLFSGINGVDDFAYGQVLLCFSVIMMSFSIGEMIGGGLATFPGLLQDGDFDRILVRPRSVIGQIIVPHMDFTRLGLLAQAVVTLCIAVPISGIHWTWKKALVFGMMIICGSVVFFCLFLITATFAFFTIQPLDFLNLFTYGMRQFGKYPFSIYGEAILRLLTFVIPLALIQYYPLLYLLDREDGIFYKISPMVSLLFLIPTYFFYRIGLKNYKSVGS